VQAGFRFPYQVSACARAGSSVQSGAPFITAGWTRDHDSGGGTGEDVGSSGIAPRRPELQFGHRVRRPELQFGHRLTRHRVRRPELQFGHRLTRLDLKDSQRSADLVGHDQQGVPVGTLLCRHEAGRLGSEIARVLAGLRLLRICHSHVTRVDIGHKPWRDRVGGVVDDDAAGPFKHQEDIRAPEDRCDRHALGLGSLVVAAVIDRVVGAAGIEMVRIGLLGQLLELLSAVEDQLSLGGPHRCLRRNG
jgi:hypothetical protein